MSGMIYFDHAATSYPKPQSVIKETVRAYTENGGNPGRGLHPLSVNSANAVYECRKQLSTLFNYDFPERVVFTYNTTYALNMAIKGVAKKNSHIVISSLEHNSVLRPVYALSQNPDNNITYSVFSAHGETEEEILFAFIGALKSNTALAVVTVASNVCGKILPIAKIGDICKSRGITLVVDAAQAAGIIPLDFSRLNADILCVPGHKGLMGPTGTGAMLISNDISPECIIEGGNGVNSKDYDMSGALPERLEAGTVNTVGISALAGGIKYVKEIGIETIFRKSSAAAEYCRLGLKAINGVKLYGDFNIKTPVVLFNVGDIPSESVAKYLAERSICVRAGFHCSPLAHAALKTGENGAVRASFGHLNTVAQVSKMLEVISKIK